MISCQSEHVLRMALERPTPELAPITDGTTTRLFYPSNEWTMNGDSFQFLVGAGKKQ